jgi:hypothetical protein
MSFYTNVSRYGNSMLYRGYDSYGKRVYRKDHFKPVFYTRAQKDVGWKSLDGQNIAPIEFENMREAKQWLEMNKDVSGRYIYGNRNYLHQYITQKFYQ